MAILRNHYKGIPESKVEDATSTKAELHIYANGTTGSDSNTGYSVSDAKKNPPSNF